MYAGSEIARGAVRAMVGHDGGEAVRVEDICELAEVGRSTFFRYFDSKEAAFVAGIHQGRAESVAEATRRRPANEDALTALRHAFLEAWADWRELRELMLLEAEIRKVSTQVQVRTLGQQVAWEQALGDALEPRLAEGPNRKVHARLLAAMVVSAVRMANERWVAAGAKQSPAKALEVALDAVVELMDGRALGRTRPRVVGGNPAVLAERKTASRTKR